MADRLKKGENPGTEFNGRFQAGVGRRERRITCLLAESTQESCAKDCQVQDFTRMAGGLSEVMSEQCEQQNDGYRHT